MPGEPTSGASSIRPTPLTRLRAVLARPRAGALLALMAVAAVAATVWGWSATSGGTVATAGAVPTPPPAVGVPSLSAEQIASLPEAGYDRVIGGLVPVTSAAVTRVQIGSLAAAAPLYRTDASRPVARMQVAGPFGDPNPIVVIANVGEWDLVLTPARQTLPSASPAGRAAAQTAGWMPARYIRGLAETSARITVRTRDQTLVISRLGEPDRVFPIAVGAAATPTPTGVTGYLEARFVNPGAGTRQTPVQLTSLHATTSDEPAGGMSGGLIALHWWPEAAGAVSHGCIRVTEQALAAVNALPLGTPITTTE
jgi:hypothetical protein